MLHLREQLIRLVCVSLLLFKNYSPLDISTASPSKKLKFAHCPVFRIKDAGGGSRTALPNFYISVNLLPGIMFLSYHNLQIFTETYLAG